VENFDRGEEAGFLICALSRLPDRDVLLAREWHPVPDAAIERNANGSVLSWSAEFNSDVLQRAVDLDATAVLVHSHGTPRPKFSNDDREKERALFSAFSRILDPLPTGTLLLGEGDAAGSFWLAGDNGPMLFRRLGRHRRDRQLLVRRRDIPSANGAPSTRSPDTCDRPG